MAVAGATPRLHRTRAPPFPAPSPGPFPPPRATHPSQLPAEITGKRPGRPRLARAPSPVLFPNVPDRGADSAAPTCGERRPASRPRVLPAPGRRPATPRARAPVSPGPPSPGVLAARAGLRACCLTNGSAAFHGPQKPLRCPRRSDSVNPPGLRGEEEGLNESASRTWPPPRGKMAVCKERGTRGGRRQGGSWAGGRGAPGVGSGDSPAWTDVALNPISV